MFFLFFKESVKFFVIFVVVNLVIMVMDYFLFFVGKYFFEYFVLFCDFFCVYVWCGKVVMLVNEGGWVVIVGKGWNIGCDV